MKKFGLLFIITIGLFVSSCNRNDEVKKESATFKVTIKNVFTPKSFDASVSFDAISPGNEMMINFNACKGAYLSFATMFVKSNDESGIKTTSNLSSHKSTFENLRDILFSRTAFGLKFLKKYDLKNQNVKIC